MKTVTLARLKRECLEILDKVQADGEDVIVTKGGKPIARLSPIRKKPKKRTGDIFGFMKGKGKITGDLVSPLPAEDWGNPA